MMSQLLIYSLIPVGVATTIYLIRKLRELQWGWIRKTYSLKEKIFIITGANTGLGYETAKALVKRDATVIMACRSLIRGHEAVAKIRHYTANGELIVLELDLASFESINQFTNEIQERFSKFDCLINNAGVATQSDEKTCENFEIHFGVNHLGHFLLINLLKDQITINSSRIVIVASLLHERGEIDFEYLGKQKNIIQSRRSNAYYNNSKLANVYCGRELFKKGFDVHVLCPGLCFTDIFRDYHPQWYHYVIFSPIIWLWMRSAKQGAQNIIYCATENVNTDKMNPSTGYLISNLRQTKSKALFDDLTSERLWRESEILCNLASV